jgi:hypothetical protein
VPLLMCEATPMVRRVLEKNLIIWIYQNTNRTNKTAGANVKHLFSSSLFSRQKSLIFFSVIHFQFSL